MSSRLLAALALAVPALVAPAAAQAPAPPVATARPVELTHHGVTRVDPYYWLNDRENPEVIAYLEAENAYAEAATAHLAPLRETLFQEIVGRIRQDEASEPTYDRGFWYYTRFEEGRDYPIFARRPGSMEAPEEILLDGNALAEGHAFYQIGSFAVADDGVTLAWTEDTVGRRIYDVRVKDLRTGQTRAYRLPSATPSLAWSADGRTLFYVRRDPQTLRAFQVVRHALGRPEADTVVFEETDPEFSVGVTRSKSGRFILVGSRQTLTTEWRYLPADAPGGAFRTLRPRERGHDYTVEHAGDAWFVRSNLGGAANFALYRAPTDTPDAWQRIVPHRDHVLLEDFDVVRGALVTQEREDGLTRLRVRDHDGALRHEVAFAEPAYAARLGDAPDYARGLVRYHYESMTTPASVYDYDPVTREATLVKRTDVLGDFDPARYVTERVWIEARDGTRVPVSLARRADVPADGSAPLLLYGYGSYGFSLPAGFSVPRLSLLDRGFVYAIAHIRGGQEMGRAWYEDGKLMRKMNTFTDFIDAAEALVARGYADPDRLYAQGGSAGGLLMGAVLNMRPDLWDGVVADVPFVDVVTTMLDDSIPLTTFEYDEWGNPNEPEAFRYMLSYSPYDNVRAQDYPAILITTGLHDSQVQYWEPAKWTARLRERKTDANPLLFRTNMAAGHGGASGRFERFREIAFSYAWLLDRAGLAN
ncbi:MAG: S9 family peptidase [Rubricoccaceae bacterium]